MKQIDIVDAHKAIEYLKSTDEEAARAKANLELLQDQKKTVDAVQFVNAEGGQGERAKIALASDEYSEHLEKINDAVFTFELIRNRRKAAELQIEMWRSINSNQRKGNI